MKKLFCVLIAATLLFCASSSIYAVGDIGEIVEIVEVDEMVSSDDVFRPCPLCGGVVRIYCSGSPNGAPSPDKTYGCSIYRHNEDEPCSVDHIYYGSIGKCTNTNCNYHSGVSSWPYKKYHQHVENHTFKNGLATETEQWGSCLVSMT